MTRLSAWATGHPLDLALFRVAVCLVVLFSADVWTAASWAQSAGGAPEGWALVSHWLPPTVMGARAATGVLLGAALLTLVGLFTQVSSLIAALAALWLLAVPQHSGQVMHTHHLAWWLALLAAAPSGDAFSLDRWRAARRGLASPGPSLAHGVPVRVAWLSIGLVFFFPGAWKALAGKAWLDGLPALVAWKWFQLGGEPLLVLPSAVLWWAGLGWAGGHRLRAWFHRPGALVTHARPRRRARLPLSPGRVVGDGHRLLLAVGLLRGLPAVGEVASRSTGELCHFKRARCTRGRAGPDAAQRAGGDRRARS